MGQTTFSQARSVSRYAVKCQIEPQRPFVAEQHPVGYWLGHNQHFGALYLYFL